MPKHPTQPPSQHTRTPPKKAPPHKSLWDMSPAPAPQRQQTPSRQPEPAFSNRTSQYVNVFLKDVTSQSDRKLIDFFSLLGRLPLHESDFIDVRTYQRIIMFHYLGIEPPKLMHENWREISKHFCRDGDRDTPFQIIMNKLAREAIPDPHSRPSISGHESSFIEKAQQHYQSQLVAHALTSIDTMARTGSIGESQARELARQLVQKTLEEKPHSLHGLIQRETLTKLQIEGLIPEEDAMHCVESVTQTLRKNLPRFLPPSTIDQEAKRVMAQEIGDILEDAEANEIEQSQKEYSSRVIREQLRLIARIPLIGEHAKSIPVTQSLKDLTEHYKTITDFCDIYFHAAINHYAFSKLKTASNIDEKVISLKAFISRTVHNDYESSANDIHQLCQELATFETAHLVPISQEATSQLKHLYDDYSRVFDRASSPDNTPSSGYVRSLPDDKIEEPIQLLTELTPVCITKALASNAQLLTDTQNLFLQPLEQRDDLSNLLVSPNPQESHTDFAKAFTQFEKAYSALGTHLFGKRIHTPPSEEHLDKSQIQEKLSDIFSQFIHFACSALQHASTDPLLRLLFRKKSTPGTNHSESSIQHKMFSHFCEKYLAPTDPTDTTGLRNPSFSLPSNWPNNQMTQSIKSELDILLREAGRTSPIETADMAVKMPAFERLATLIIGFASAVLKKTTIYMPTDRMVPRGREISVHHDLEPSKTTVLPNINPYERCLPICQYRTELTKEQLTFKSEKAGFITGMVFGFLLLIPGIILLAAFLHKRNTLSKRDEELNTLYATKEEKGETPHTQGELDQLFEQRTSAWSHPCNLFSKRNKRVHNAIRQRNNGWSERALKKLKSCGITPRIITQGAIQEETETEWHTHEQSHGQGQAIVEGPS